MGSATSGCAPPTHPLPCCSPSLSPLYLLCQFQDVVVALHNGVGCRGPVFPFGRQLGGAFKLKRHADVTEETPPCRGAVQRIYYRQQADSHPILLPHSGPSLATRLGLLVCLSPCLLIPRIPVYSPYTSPPYLPLILLAR